MTSNAAAVRAWRESKRGTEPPYHGTAHIYNSYACRCDECRQAATDAARRFARRRRGRH